MKKEILKTILIIILCIIIGFILAFKKHNKFVYIEDKEKAKCYKCIKIDNQYYCEISISKEGDK